MSSRIRSGSSVLLSATALISFGVPRGCAPTPAPTPPPPPAAVSVSVSADIQRVVDLTNAERAARGLAGLTIDSRLVAAAQGHSNDQAAFNSLNHDGSDYSNPKDRMVRQGFQPGWWAENVASGYASSDDVMSGWMNSSGHRKNILNSRVTHIGVAVAYAADGTPYWTMKLASGG
jgi:uncharacterized protein YkwD